MVSANKYWLASLLLISAPVAAQIRTTVVIVRVLDGPTGLPADAKKVHLFCRMADSSVCPVMQRLETKVERKAGIARFEVPEDAKTIYQYGTGSAECDFDSTRPLGPGGYATFADVSLAKIKAEGVLFENKCRTDKTVPPPNQQSGELVVFYTGGYTVKSVLTGIFPGH